MPNSMKKRKQEKPLRRKYEVDLSDLSNDDKHIFHSCFLYGPFDVLYLNDDESHDKCEDIFKVSLGFNLSY